MKNKRCSLSGPLMLKAKSSKKFSNVQKFAKFWPFRGPGDQGVWKVAVFTTKVSFLREPTSFEPFFVKIGWRVWPPGVSRKKSQKVSNSHRNDVSPLTQGLRCRAACDDNNNDNTQCMRLRHVTPHELCGSDNLNKKAQLTLTNPRDAEAYKNCSNSTCFVSFHRIPFRQISHYRCIASCDRWW